MRVRDSLTDLSIVSGFGLFSCHLFVDVVKNVNPKEF